MRHGPRGAAELAETVDRLVDFAAMTRAVSSTLIDLIHDAYLGDAAVRDFLVRENPAAARAIAARLDAARRNGLVAPPPQRCRRRPCGDAGGADMKRARLRSCAAAPAPACRRRCRPETACWCASCRCGSDSARRVHRAVRRGARPRQRHHGDHRARQPAGARVDAGARRRCLRPRWLALGIAAADGVPVLAGRCATMPAIIDASSLPRNCAGDCAGGAGVGAEGLGRGRRRRPCISTRSPPTEICAPSIGGARRLLIAVSAPLPSAEMPDLRSRLSRHGASAPSRVRGEGRR